MTADDLDALVAGVATLYGLPRDLLAAQVQQESGGDPYAFRYEHGFFVNYIRNNAKAKAGIYGPLAACSYGLLQIILETAYELDYSGPPHGLFDPKLGLAYGCKQMLRLIDWAAQDYHKALAAYNAGRGNVQAGMAYANAVWEKAGRDA